MTKDDQLIEQLKLTIKAQNYPRTEYANVTHRPKLPVTQADIELAESLLGYSLPPFLKRIYLEVGNGAFGPGYGLVQLLTPFGEDELESFSIVHTTLTYRKGKWPEKLLYISEWGCNIYSCIDCSRMDYPIIRTEQTWHKGIEAPSLQQWLNDWLEGKPLFDLGENWKNLPPVTF